MHGGGRSILSQVTPFQHQSKTLISTDRCSLLILSNYSHQPIAGFPMMNIGITYFKSRAGVIRCTYNWLFDMWQEVRDRPNVWDQDIFRKVFFHCARQYGLSLQVFSPRVFNSHCYKPCGCNYTDAEIESSKDHNLRPIGRDMSGVCPSSTVSRWMLMHFPCSGVSEDKAAVMKEFTEMFQKAKEGSQLKVKTGF